MSKQRIFVFEYHARGSTNCWDTGQCRSCDADSSDYWRHGEARLLVGNERRVEVGVFDADGHDPNSQTFDCNDAAELADKFFAERFPERVLMSS